MLTLPRRVLRHCPGLGFVYALRGWHLFGQGWRLHEGLHFDVHPMSQGLLRALRWFFGLPQVQEVRLDSRLYYVQGRLEAADGQAFSKTLTPTDAKTEQDWEAY